MTADDIRRLAVVADAELQVRDGRAWVVVVRQVDAARASALAQLVDELAAQPSLHRVSADLTCTTPSDRRAATILGGLRLRAAPSVDVTAPGAVSRLFRPRHAA